MFLAYYCPNWKANVVLIKTNKPMNTACRSPGMDSYSFLKSLTVFPVLPLTGFIFLNLLGLLECLVMWLISMPVIKV